MEKNITLRYTTRRPAATLPSLSEAVAMLTVVATTTMQRHVHAAMSHLADRELLAKGESLLQRYYAQALGQQISKRQTRLVLAAQLATMVTVFGVMSVPVRLAMLTLTALLWRQCKKSGM